MQITLPESLTQYIYSQMATGQYRDASELISAALQQKILLDTRSDHTSEALRREIMLGWDEAERGEFAGLDLVSLKQDLDAMYHG